MTMAMELYWHTRTRLYNSSLSFKKPCGPLVLVRSGPPWISLPLYPLLLIHPGLARVAAKSSQD